MMPGPVATKTARLLRLEHTAGLLACLSSDVVATRVHDVDRAHDLACRSIREATTEDERQRARAEVRRLELVMLLGYPAIDRDGAR